MKHSFLALGILVPLLTACSVNPGLVYGYRAHVDDQAQMDADSRRVQAAERAERAEYRRERREMMMDEADAYRRSGAGNVYIVR